MSELNDSPALPLACVETSAVALEASPASSAIDTIDATATPLAVPATPGHDPGVLGTVVAIAEEELLLKLWMAKLEVDLTLVGAQLVRRVGAAAFAHPGDFAMGVLRGAWSEIKSMVTGPLELVFAATCWIVKASGCAEVTVALGLAEATIDTTLPAIAFVKDECEAFFAPLLRTVADLDQQVEHTMVLIDTMSQHPLDAIFDLVQSLREMATVIDGLLNDDRILSKLKGLVGDPTRAGTVVGAILVNLLLLAGGEGITALRAAAAARRLGATAQATVDAARLARIVEVEGRLSEMAQEARLAAAEPLDAEIIELLELLRDAIREHGASLRRTVTAKKYDLAAELEGRSAASAKALREAGDTIVSVLRDLRGRVGSYRSLKAQAGDFNAHSQLMHLLESTRLDAPASLLSSGELELSAALRERVLDSAHLFDARFFDYLSPEAKELLQYATAEDLPAVLATAAEHNSSSTGFLRKVFPRSGPGGTDVVPASLDEFKTISETFESTLLKVDEHGIPLPDQPYSKQRPKDWVPIKKGMKDSELFKAHLDIWKRKQFSGPGGVAFRGAIEHLQGIIDRLVAAGL